MKILSGLQALGIATLANWLTLGQASQKAQGGITVRALYQKLRTR